MKAGGDGIRGGTRRIGRGEGTVGLLIDGYNLLWGGGATLRPAPRSSHAPTPLARAREALLELLVDLIPPGRRKRTQIVFDAANAPVGLPKVRSFEGVEVIFARDYADADALLEELIERSSAPRGLTVVSSDRRVQFAARRRGAIVMDSDRWMRESFAARDAAERAEAGGPHPGGRGKRTAKLKVRLKPPDPCPADVAGWLSYFRFDAATSDETIVSESWEVAARATRQTAEPQVVWSAADADEEDADEDDAAESAEAERGALPTEAAFFASSPPAEKQSDEPPPDAAFDLEAAMEAALGLDGVRLPADRGKVKRSGKPAPLPARPPRPSVDGVPVSAEPPVRPSRPSPRPTCPAEPTADHVPPLAVPKSVRPAPPASPARPEPFAPPPSTCAAEPARLASPSKKKPAAPPRPTSKRPPLLGAGDDVPTLTAPQDVVPLPPVVQGGGEAKTHRPPSPPPRPRAAHEKHAAAMDKRRAAGPSSKESFPQEMLDDVARLLAEESPSLPPVEPLPPKK